MALAALPGSCARHGPRHAPFGIAAAAAASGLLVTVLLVRDTAAHVELEHRLAAEGVEGGPSELSTRFLARLWYASWAHRPLFAANQAGLVKNLNAGLAWGLLPLYFAEAGLSVREIGWLATPYPAVWGVGRIGTGAMPDQVGRRPLIAGGMLLQAFALGIFAPVRGCGAGSPRQCSSVSGRPRSTRR